MKVAFIGNQDNNGYRLCKWLNAMGRKGQLFMLPLIPRDDSRSLPELVDPGIKGATGGYPSWIHNHCPRAKYWYLKSPSFSKHVENEFDVVITSGLSGLLAANLFQNVPIIHMSLGSEVTEIPLLLFKLKVGFQKRLISLFSRRALKRANLILTGFKPTMKTIHALNLEKKLRVWGFPEDVSQNSNRMDASLFEKLNTDYGKYQRVFLWLSRINYLNKSSSAYKGPEKFLKAFEKIAGQYNGRVKLIIGEHGADIDPYKRIIADKGLDVFVDFIPHLPYQKLLSYLSLPNAVIFDELDKEKGELSGIAREALSVGAVVVKTIDSDLIELCFGSACPVVNAFDVPSCYAAMKYMMDCDNEQFKQLKQSSLKWASQYLHYEHNASKLIEYLREIVFCHKFKIEH